MIEEMRLTNLLSFGDGGETIRLRALNLIIGPNGSGKSNLIEAIDLLRNAPGEITKAIGEGGGVRDWLWKRGRQPVIAQLDAVIANPQGQTGLRYVMAFSELGQRFRLEDERIENCKAFDGHQQPYFYYKFQNGHPVLNANGEKRNLKLISIDPARSVLAQFRDPLQYPEITFLAETLPKIRIYREWSFGRRTLPRVPQKADLPTDFLEPDASNLGLVLNRLRSAPEVKARLLRELRKLYDGIDDYDVLIEGGTVQVYLYENGVTIPATRLSDGTLRYLCLLAILCHPNPPPLVCIEEPELGLHPDILPTVADLLRDASSRCQLIVTTHSDILVDAMTETPEDLLICEKRDGATFFRRLSADDLKLWLERYRLGELWTRGELGGTRW